MKVLVGEGVGGWVEVLVGRGVLAPEVYLAGRLRTQAHRLKNPETIQFKALYDLPTVSRIMISGTPVQNVLKEFHALIDFCIPQWAYRQLEPAAHMSSPILAST